MSMDVDIFPFNIGTEINKDFFRQVNYEPWNGCWVVNDGDVTKAEQLKQMMPHAYVLIRDPVTNTYTRYTIKLLVPNMKIKDGAFVEEFETWTV